MGKSSSLEDYMKSILILSNRNGSVRSVDIAEELGVSKPSVSNAMKRLRKANMICFAKGGEIVFTEEGRVFAERVYNKHSLLSRVLRFMGVSKETADKEACLMEHAISDETYECLDEFINAHEAAEGSKDIAVAK